MGIEGVRMKLIEITKAEYEKLWADCHYYYFCNGCIFDEETENLVAFEWYKGSESEPSKWFKVVEDAD